MWASTTISPFSSSCATIRNKSGLSGSVAVSNQCIKASKDINSSQSKSPLFFGAGNVILTKVEEIRVDDLPVESVSKDDVFSMKIDQVIRPSSKLYKIIGKPS